MDDATSKIIVAGIGAFGAVAAVLSGLAGKRAGAKHRTASAFVDDEQHDHDRAMVREHERTRSLMREHADEIIEAVRRERRAPADMFPPEPIKILGKLPKGEGE